MAALGPLLQNEELIVGQPEEFRGEQIVQRVVAAEQRHQGQIVEAAAHPIDHPEFVLLPRQAQEVEQEIAHGPIGVFDPPPLLVLVRALVLRSPGRRLDHGLALARIAGGLAPVPGGVAFGARPVAPRRHRQLPGIEGAALRLVMGKIRLAKDVGQKAKLVGPIEDRPDIAGLRA